MGRTLVGLGTVALSVVVGCGGTGPNGFFGLGDGGGGGGSGGSGGSGPGDAMIHFESGGGGAGGSSGDDDGGDCSAASKLVYVIDDVGVLYSFDPPTLTFTMIGPTNCPGAGGMINSMAVDRSATAWVNAVNGNIYKVSTSDASCEATSFVVGQDGFGPQFGMGFSANTPGGTAETLFIDGIGVDGGGGAGLASLNVSTLSLDPIGQFTGAISDQDCELTGTGDGRLFGFFTTTPASVARIDKANATVLSSAPQPGVDTGTDWAFSFWGGSFYLYTANQEINPDDTSDVTEYDPTAGTTKVVLSEIGFRIVGAGVSTCAPVVPPPVH